MGTLGEKWRNKVSNFT